MKINTFSKKENELDILYIPKVSGKMRELGYTSKIL